MKPQQRSLEMMMMDDKKRRSHFPSGFIENGSEPPLLKNHMRKLTVVSLQALLYAPFLVNCKPKAINIVLNKTN